MSTNNKWQALSMKDRAFLIREAVRNGITDIDSIRDTWEHRFDGNSDTINGGEIQTVTITPEKWQKEFDEFSKKNPEIRESIDENWVLPDRRRKSKEMERQFDRDFLEGNMDYDEYKKHYSRQKNRSNRFPVYYDTSSDRIYKRILDVYKAAGEPRIYTGEGRPYYRKRVIGKHSIHNISTIDDFIEELAHPIEGTKIITWIKDLPKTLKGELTRSYEHYEDPSHFEYKTHKIVEPSLRKYILKGGHTPYIHEYSGEKEGQRIQTDTDHRTDGSLIERIALNIGSQEAVVDKGHANVRSIITGTIDALLGKEPRNNTNLAAFLGKPEDYGFEEITDNRGPQFDDRISQYETQNFKTYKGVINPFNEYVVSQEDYDKFLELAKTGDIFYGNADWDNVRYAHDIINSRNTMTTYDPLHKGYRDDVQNYPIQFYTKNGKLFANAADFYDFNTDSFQGKTLTKRGNPYILRQNDIPVRAIYVPEHLIDVEPRYWVDDNEFTDEIRRALNMRRTIKIREEQEKLKKIKK